MHDPVADSGEKEKSLLGVVTCGFFFAAFHPC